MNFTKINCFAFSVMISFNCFSAEWLAEPSLYIESFYNDNTQLFSADETSSSGVALAPGISLQANELNWDMSFDTQLKSKRYSDAAQIDSDAVFSNLGMGYQTERSQWNFDSSYSKNSTYDTDFDTELLAANIETIENESETVSFSPSVSFVLTEGSLLSLSFTASEVQYDSNVNSQLEGYKTQEYVLSYLWSFSESSQIGVTFLIMDYENGEDTVVKFRNSVAQLNYNYTFSETSTFNVSIGNRILDTQQNNVLTNCIGGIQDLLEFIVYQTCTNGVPVYDDFSDKDSGVMASLGFNVADELDSYEVNLNRTVAPSSFGGALQVDDLLFKYGREITPRSKLVFLVNGNKTETLDATSSSNDREKLRFESKLVWQMKEHWELSIKYQYLKQTVTSSGQEGESNSIYVNLRMNWPGMTWAN